MTDHAVAVSARVADILDVDRQCSTERSRDNVNRRRNRATVYRRAVAVHVRIVLHPGRCEDHAADIRSGTDTERHGKALEAAVIAEPEGDADVEARLQDVADLCALHALQHLRERENIPRTELNAPGVAADLVGLTDPQPHIDACLCAEAKRDAVVRGGVGVGRQSPTDVISTARTGGAAEDHLCVHRCADGERAQDVAVGHLCRTNSRDVDRTGDAFRAVRFQGVSHGRVVGDLLGEIQLGGHESGDLRQLAASDFLTFRVLALDAFALEEILDQAAVAGGYAFDDGARAAVLLAAVDRDTDAPGEVFLEVGIAGGNSLPELAGTLVDVATVASGDGFGEALVDREVLDQSLIAGRDTLDDRAGSLVQPPTIDPRPHPCRRLDAEPPGKILDEARVAGRNPHPDRAWHLVLASAGLSSDMLAQALALAEVFVESLVAGRNALDDRAGSLIVCTAIRGFSR